MSTDLRRMSRLDALLDQCQTVLSTLGANAHAKRANPAQAIITDELKPHERRHSAGLMRVNHSGEVCAQGLYQGQALTARNAATKQALQQSAEEEVDHLAWCQQRLQELGSRTSYLDPLWYLGAFSLGAIAGMMGDALSLGFVVETEKQVEQHLASHLQRLPANDHKSFAIVEQMQHDEIEHAKLAQAHGARVLPQFVQRLMRYAAKLMTQSAYYF